MPISTRSRSGPDSRRVVLLLATCLCIPCFRSVCGARALPVVPFSLPSSITLGEPLMLTMDCRNDGDEKATIDLGRNFRSNVYVRVTFPDGHWAEFREPRPAGDYAFQAGAVSLPPHRSATRRLLEDQFRVWVDRMVTFGETGRYVLQFGLADSDWREWNGPDPDPAATENGLFELIVESRNEAVLGRRCKQLFEQSQVWDVVAKDEALEGLGYVSDPVAVAYLREWLRSNPNLTPSEIVTEGLARIGGDAAARALMEELGSPIRARAGLARIGLIRLRSTVRDPELRRTVERAIDPDGGAARSSGRP